MAHISFVAAYRNKYGWAAKSYDTAADAWRGLLRAAGESTNDDSIIYYASTISDDCDVDAEEPLQLMNTLMESQDIGDWFIIAEGL